MTLALKPFHVDVSLQVIEHIADDFWNIQNAIDVVVGVTSEGEPVVADSSFNSVTLCANRGVQLFWLANLLAAVA